MSNKDFDNKENLGHGIKGDISNANKNLKSEKNKMNDKVNNLRNEKEFK